MDILISIAAKVSEYTVAPIGRQLGYLFFYRRNIEDLNTKIVDLGHVKARVQHKVEEAQNNARGIEADVSDWLAKADKIITEDHGNFKQDEEQANTRCICGAKFPNLVLRHRLSRRARKMAETVAAQTQKAANINEVSYGLNLPISVGNKGYEEFQSRKRTLIDVMEALRDPNVGMVGVWGMGGVGKTMLAKEVARRAMGEEKLFTNVVLTAISGDPNIEKVQQDIGEKLNMEFRDVTKDARAERLRNRLREENNILIIVDDIWDELDLEEVGISFGNDKKGCKILLTTRSRHVLANDMDVNSNFIFHVGGLLENEAKSLFRKIVGDQVEEHDDLATQIVNECGGLPIAITTVASALKNKKCADWKNVLHELRKSNPFNIPGMEKKVYNSIKLSYDYLESVDAKHLLLLCSLFPEDEKIEIRVLCDYGFGLDLFEGVNTLEEARNKTDALVTKLKDHSLLLDADSYLGYECVKLHDVVRDIVIYVASKLDDRHRMHNIRNADELEKYFNKEMFKDSTAISLYGIKADQYPQTLKGPKLNLLRLVPHVPQFTMMNSKELPHQFFEGLNKLLVLDCELTSLKPLPAASSSCLLPNLQTLRLTHECSLGDISWIGELKSLKILDLSFNYSITELPRGIGKLNRLLSLNLEGCFKLKVIEPNVISSLTHLEELNLKDSFSNWEVEGVANASNERRNANLSEVKELRHLNDLKLEVEDINSLPKDIFSENLEKYYIRIGRYSGWGGDEKKNTSRMLQLELCPNNALNEHDFAALLGRSETLCLSGLKISKSVAFEIDGRGFQRLKHLKVEQSTEIECIVNWNNGNMDCPTAAFPRLESLALKNLMNLENIIHEKLTTKTAFGQLRDIQVSYCDKLKSLFSLFNIPKQLERIEVKDCEMMEEIISYEGDHVEEIEISQLQSLKLSRVQVRNCNKLKSLFSLFNIPKQLERIEVENCEMMEEIISHDGDHDEEIEISQLQSLKLLGLPKLVQFIATSKSDEIKREGRQSIDAPLFNGQVAFPNLDILHIESLNFQKIWKDVQLSPSRFGFQSLKQVDVKNCDHLKGLIPSGVTASLVHLRNLKVSHCKAMKEIVFIEESTQVMGIYVSFARLESLQLNDLPNLERFCGGDFSSPQLESLGLYDLPNLERFCGGDCVDCPSLSKLTINGCKKLKVFIKNITPMTTTEKEDKNLTGSVAGKQHLSHNKLVFPKLDELDISSLNIQKIWNDDQLTSSRSGVQNLTQIKVDRCDHLKGLIPACMTASLVYLRNLNVRHCKAMKEIVSIEESTQVMGIYVLFPRLESLQLSNLPVLERFCGGDFSSPQLESLELCYLKNLERFCGGDFSSPQLEYLTLFDLSNLERFCRGDFSSPQLISLKLFDLSNLERFCGGDFSSPQLESLKLYDLPNLERFCGGDCVDCPSLSNLTIKGCEKLKVFITNTIPTTAIEKEDKDSTGSVADKRNLSHHKDIVKVNQLSTECSCSEITCQPPPLGSAEEHDEYLVFETKCLSKLKLWNFPNQQQLPKTFPTVKLLSICEWGIGLKNLATPLMSFQNLNDLTVKDCHGLTSLFSPSTAKSLSQRLTKLRIIGCKSLGQVIANDDDDNINIIFSQLECLVLDDLSNLTSFYSGNNNAVLQFPHLAQLRLNCSPEMKTFCHANVHCPSLHSITLAEWKPSIWQFMSAYWKGDINTTIQKLWEEKNIRDSSETEESVENVDNDAEEDEAVGP